MPVPIYRAEITVWSLFPSDDDLADPTSGCTLSAHFNVFQQAVHPGPTLASYGIKVYAEPNPSSPSQYRLRYSFYFGAAGVDPDTWTSDAGAPDLLDNTPVFVFPQGITLAVQIDFDNNQVSYQTPAGTRSRAIAVSPIAGIDDQPLYPSCFGLGIVPPSGAPQAFGGEACFRDWFGYTDGQAVTGAHLDSVDPGTFSATTLFSTGINPVVPFTEAQDATCYRMTYAQSDPPVARAPTRALRCGDAAAVTEDEPWYVDAVVNPDTGTVLATVVLNSACDFLLVYRSTDNGDTFSRVVVEADVGDQYSWPQIMVDPRGVVHLFYNNGQRGRLYYARSYTDGLTWETGGFLNIFDQFTGAPTTLAKFRHRMDISGVVWAINPFMGNGTTVPHGIFMQRYPGRLGEDPTSSLFTVDTGITVFERPDLYWLSRGEARSFYPKGGTGQLQRSNTWGSSWESVMSGRPSDRRQTTIAHPRGGATAHLWQSGLGGAVRFGLSPDGGETFTFTQSLTGVGVEFQYPALAQGNRNQLFAFQFEGSLPALTLHCYRSANWGVTWVDTGATFP